MSTRQRLSGPALLLALALAALAAPARAGVEVRAFLEPKLVGAGELVTLTVEVRSDGFDRLSFRPDFQLENLEIVGGPYEQEDIRFVNGDLSRAFRLSWRLRTLGPGPARVHALAIRLGSRQVAIGEREIQVQEEPTGAGRGGGWEDEEEEAFQDPLERLFGSAPFRRERDDTPAAFLRAEIRPQNPYAGEQVVYTVHLYTRQDILAANAREIPKFKGFWVRDIPQPERLPTELVDIDGARYSRVVLLQKALFPLRPGRHVVEPTAMDLMVRTIERRFFGPPLSRSEQLLLRTEPKRVDVRPLPPAPPGFGGAVGDLTLGAQLEPQEVRLGEAATLTLTLAGEGNLQAAQQPQVAPAPGVQVLPPQQHGEEKLLGTEVHGSRTWSFVVIPGRTGRQTLQVPPVSFFDPETGQYRTAAVAPVELTTLPRAPQAGTGEPSLHGIRSASFAAGLAGLEGRWREILPWLFALPWALALVLVLARRRTITATATLPEPAAAPSAERRFQQRLDEARTETRPRQAAAQIEEAWREFLAARWDIPCATHSARWSAMLEERGADPEAARELVRLVEDLHYLRFAPQLSSTEPLRGEALDRCRRLVRRLR